MKYIDAEKLKAEIERRRLSNRYIDTESYENELLEIIDSLQQEQPEVDLKKEYAEFVEADPVYSKLVNDVVGRAIARHFAEWGAIHLNARKEE